MKKETLLEIILGTIGGLIFAIGMCMCLIPEWDLFKVGVVVAIIGFIILLCIIPVYRKEHPKKVVNKKTDWGLVLTWIIGVVGALIMGFGMSKIMVGSPEKMDMIIGMITGIVGLLICVLNYPIYSYLKSNK
ncbi:MAG: hypothetical protein E7170_03130 [Firmicutes bacterium]|nr:hypothetical protein [Bacillota bacterium]